MTHIYQGNKLNIDPRRIVAQSRRHERQAAALHGERYKRQDKRRSPRGQFYNGRLEIMAVLCLSSSITDLKEHCLVVSYTYDEKPVTAGDLKAQGALTALLKDALKPHGSDPRAHSCFRARRTFREHRTRMQLRSRHEMRSETLRLPRNGSRIQADLGAEKFFDIKCRIAGLKPDAAVIVASVRALKHHGGVAKRIWYQNLRLSKGSSNLLQHISMSTVFKVPQSSQ